MSKVSKNLALVLLLVLVGLCVFNLFGGGSQPATANAAQKNGETHWAVTFLVSWGPMLVLMFMYGILLKIMKRLVIVVERIAVAVERLPAGHAPQSYKSSTAIDDRPQATQE